MVGGITGRGDGEVVLDGVGHNGLPRLMYVVVDSIRDGQPDSWNVTYAQRTWPSAVITDSRMGGQVQGSPGIRPPFAYPVIVQSKGR